MGPPAAGRLCRASAAAAVAVLASLLAWPGREVVTEVRAFQQQLRPPAPTARRRRGDSPGGARNPPRERLPFLAPSSDPNQSWRRSPPRLTMAVVPPEVQEEKELQAAAAVVPLLQEDLPAQEEAPRAEPDHSALAPAALGGVSPATVVASGSSASVPLPSSSNSNSALGIWAARGLLLLVAAIWGTNFASVKYLEGLCFHPPCHHPASEFAFARFGVAALASVPFLIGQNRRVILAGIECGLTIALGYVSQALALESIPSGECAFICSLTVVVVPLAAALLYGRPVKVQHGVAAAVALLGVGILEGMVDVGGWLAALSGSGGGALVAASHSAADPASLAVVSAAASSPAPAAAEAVAAAASAVGGNTVAHSYGVLEPAAAFLGVSPGDLLALGQPLGFGYSFLRIEHYQEEFRHVPNRVLTIAAAQCVCVGILSCLWVLSDYHFVLPDFGYLAEPHRVAVILWTGIVTTLLAIYLEGVALQTATATDASIAFSSEPVWASLFGFWLLGETLGAESYVGGTVILAACLVGALADAGEAKKVVEAGAPPPPQSSDAASPP